eukprot:5452912-Amphidinium_carterae.1
MKFTGADQDNYSPHTYLPAIVKPTPQLRLNLACCWSVQGILQQVVLQSNDLEQWFAAVSLLHRIN